LGQGNWAAASTNAFKEISTDKMIFETGSAFVSHRNDIILTNIMDSPS
jgi:hypothetical protein